MSPPINSRDSLAVRLKADQARAGGQWSLALDLYDSLPNADSNSALLLNRAICYLALGQAEQSCIKSERALRLQPSLWQAGVVLVKSQKLLGHSPQWIETLERLYREWSEIPEVIAEYAAMVMNVYGAAEEARRLVQPLCKNHEYAEFATNLQLMSFLYDRPADLSASALTSLIKAYSKKYLRVDSDLRKRSDSEVQKARAYCRDLALPTPVLGKKRIGAVSGLFSASPVHFLTINAFREIVAQGHQLIVFSRSGKFDWATEQWKRLASTWVDCSQWSPVALEALFSEASLDEMFDMAGWTDTDVLKALASKPAKVQIKWVGGQSCTTGMDCFDGYITDQIQTPKSTYDLYTEPLISLGNHYVTYTPPPYMPSPVERDSSLTLSKIQKRATGTLGVIANPVKLSRSFLTSLRTVLFRMPQGIKLHLIDRRYQFAPTRNRVMSVLGAELADRVQFISPPDHPAFLDEMNRVDLLIDTYPYSGGLTVCEARHLKIPIVLFQYDRRLFCERHVLSHLELS